jgi:hypothetical protein
MAENILFVPFVEPVSQGPRYGIELNTLESYSVPQVNAYRSARQAEHDIGCIGVEKPVF